MQEIKHFERNFSNMNWIENTSEGLKDGTFLNVNVERDQDNKITLPYLITFLLSEKEMWKIERTKKYIQQNQAYVCRLAIKRDHLIDYYEEIKKQDASEVDIEAVQIAIKGIDELGHFVENCLRNNRWNKIFDENNKFCLGTASLIYNENYKKFYEHLAQVKKEKKKGINKGASKFI